MGKSAGSGFSGIDPELLETTIASFKKDKDRLRASATSIKASFTRYGIDTKELVGLLAIAGWADDQLPMLQRRHHLAIAADKKYPGRKGMVQIDEKLVGQTAQSQRNGKKLGDEFREKLESGGDITPEMFARLNEYRADGDYVKAFYDRLGPEWLNLLSLQMGDRMNDHYEDDPEQREKDRKVIADTFGTYTQVAFEGKSTKARQQAWDKWFDKFSIDEYDGFRPDRLTPFLKGGKHGKDFLVALGDRVYDKDRRTDENRWMEGDSNAPGEWSKDGYTQLLDAISKNPEAAGEWTDHNHEVVQHGLYNTGENWPSQREKAFFSVLSAGSVTLKRAHPRLAEKNAAWLIYENYKHRKGSLKGLHPIDGTGELYASIMTAYWKDVEYGITSPAGGDLWKGGKDWDERTFFKAQDGRRGGLEISRELWGEFMVEAGRDPQAAGVLGALFQGYEKKIAHQENNVDRDRSTPDSMRYLSSRKGLMMQFYFENMRTASGELEMDRDKWIAETNAYRDGLIDHATTVAMGGTAGAGMAGMKGAAIGIAYTMGSGILTGWIKEGFHVDEKDAPAELNRQIKEVEKATIDTSWQASYQRQANDLLAGGQGRNGSGFDRHVIPEVTVRQVDGTEKVYSGDPGTYIKGDPDRNFLNRDGSIKESMTPTQRTAYSEWLQDPAVVHKIYEPFADGRNSWDWPGQTEEKDKTG
ncbi:hypothetical protein [Streptomyces sp. XD-27]|uniref:hypothetical protein n=1 Tax=Streptomyces sp. XD-27 TaxID=3062779 RepID=UPI0026F44D8A|nr:hypothetical protein [Streptomyces sp. XD-27]WKX70968.1 hypothetical protein Q3Y56_14565 [Streptomyces sp. XD-27]